MRSRARLVLRALVTSCCRRKRCCGHLGADPRRNWNPLVECRTIGATQMRLPFLCPMDYVLGEAPLGLVRKTHAHPARRRAHRAARAVRCAGRDRPRRPGPVDGAPVRHVRDHQPPVARALLPGQPKVPSRPQDEQDHRLRQRGGASASYEPSLPRSPPRSSHGHQALASCATLLVRGRAQTLALGAAPEESWTAQDGLAVALPPDRTDQQLRDALQPYERVKIWRCVPLADDQPCRFGTRGTERWRTVAALSAHVPRRFADAAATFKVRSSPDPGDQGWWWWRGWATHAACSRPCCAVLRWRAAGVLGPRHAAGVGGAARRPHVLRQLLGAVRLRNAACHPAT